MKQSFWIKHSKNITNKTSNNNCNMKTNLQRQQILSTKHNKISHKKRLKTDMENQDSRCEKNQKAYPQSTKNSLNGKSHFFENGKSDLQKQLKSKHSVCEYIFKKSQKAQKRHAFKNQTQNINYSQLFKKKDQKIFSFEKIYRNSRFSPSVRRASQEKLSKNKSPKKQQELIYQLQKVNQKKKKSLFFINKRKYSLTDTHSRSLEKQLTKFKLIKKIHYNNTKNISGQPEKYNLLIKKPISSEEALKYYRNKLKKHEMIQIEQFQEIYYLSKINDVNGTLKGGFDDKKGHYIIKPHDHIIYRYQVLQLIGKGSFGQVFKSYDHKNQEYVALKIIRNRNIPNSQARIQYSILQYIKEVSEQNCFNIVAVKESFIFRSHFFMTFQLLSMNLYQLIKINKFLPLSLELVRRISIQILSALLFLFKHSIIHCDIKPENILLRNSQKSGIKLIDFGSSCFVDQKLYTYIQSRYYRAPEVILGLDYSTEIDMWSFGCVVAELRLGYPIFCGENQDQQISLITQVIGIPQKNFYKQCQRGNYYFEQEKILKDRDGIQIEPKTRNLNKLFNEVDFIDFLERIFVWEPKKRISPLEALKHEWILKGLPKQIKQQHLQFLQEQKTLLDNIFKARQSKINKDQGNTISQSLMIQAIKIFQ